jgi:hypothetical protein
MIITMKALDIVRTPKGGIAFITETNDNGKKASISYINNLNIGEEHNAWWNENELEVIDSIPRLIAEATCHPFGKGSEDVKKFF